MERQADSQALETREALRAAVLRARYPEAPIYRQLAREVGSDPLRAVQLQPDHERQA